jgi:hypothetical protein
MTITLMRSTAMAMLMGFPLSAGLALAQQSDATGQGQQPAGQAAGEGQSGQETAQAGGASDPQAQGRQEDAVVATVGDAEIRGSDVMTVIGMLPPRVQAQPAQMLVPMALEHLILRELILEEARAQNLAEDPEVVALVEGAAQGAEEDAMVQVWIDRELAGATTDAEVERVYGTLRPQGQEAVPPMSELRPQIVQHLRQEAMQEIGDRLRRDAVVVFYDPSGQPIRQDQAGQESGDGQEMQTGQDTGPGAEIEGTQSTTGESEGAGDEGADAPAVGTGSSTDN